MYQGRARRLLTFGGPRPAAAVGLRGGGPDGTLIPSDAGAMEVVFRYSRRTTLPLDLSEAHLFYLTWLKLVCIAGSVDERECVA